MQPTDPLGTGQGSHPSTLTPPNLPPGVKDAVGRALMQGIARVERYLRRRRLPSGDVEDVALECACLTYRNVVSGALPLPPDVADYEPRLGAYMHTMAWRIVRNFKRSGDLYRRGAREPGIEALVTRTYDVEPAIELASEIAAEPPKARAFLLAMLATGGGVRFAHEAAVNAGMKKNAGKWALRRTRERAANRLKTAA